MYTIPKQVNLAIVPSQIMPGAVVAAIFQNGRYLRNKEAQNLQLLLYNYIGFVRRRFQKKYCEMYHTALSDIVKAILQNGGHFQSNTSISETKRHRAFNVDFIYRFCGAWNPKKVLPNTSCPCIRYFGGHFTKMATIFNVMRQLFQTMRQRNVTVLSTHIIYGQHNSDSALLRASHNCGHNLVGCCGYLF